MKVQGGDDLNQTDGKSASAYVPDLSPVHTGDYSCPVWTRLYNSNSYTAGRRIALGVNP